MRFLQILYVGTSCCDLCKSQKIGRGSGRLLWDFSLQVNWESKPIKSHQCDGLSMIWTTTTVVQKWESPWALNLPLGNWRKLWKGEVVFSRDEQTIWLFSAEWSALKYLYIQITLYRHSRLYLETLCILHTYMDTIAATLARFLFFSHGCSILLKIHEKLSVKSRN